MAWEPSGGMVFWLSWPRSGSSRSGFLWGLLLLGTLISGRQVDGWSWIMADTKVPLPTCPGRCLEVNTSGSQDPNDFRGREVGFGSCQISSASQQWVVQNVSSYSSPITIMQPNSQQTLCLQPLNRSGLTVVVADCSGSSLQNWVVYDQPGQVRTQDALGDSPGEPLFLTMLYHKDMQNQDPKHPWHGCTLSSMSDSRLHGSVPNITNVMSVVPNSTYFNTSAFSGQTTGGSLNDIVRNGDFQLSSYMDDSLSEADLSVELPEPSDDIFGLCFWSVSSGTVTLKASSVTPDGLSVSLSLLLYGHQETGAVGQVVPTVPGASYFLIFEMAAQQGCLNFSQVRVSVSPSNSGSMIFNTSGSDASLELGWVSKGLSFQAESEWTNITFESLTSPQTGCGPSLNNVKAVAVDPALAPTAFSGYSPPSPEAGLLPRDPNSSVSQQGHADGYPSVTLSRGAISGIVLGAAAIAFGVGSLAFLLLILPLSNKLNKRNSSEQMLPKADNQWDSSPSSSSSVNTVPVHELE